MYNINLVKLKISIFATIYFNSFVLSDTCLNLLAFLLFIDIFVIKWENHISMNRFIHLIESLCIVLETKRKFIQELLYYLKTVLVEVRDTFERTDIARIVSRVQIRVTDRPELPVETQQTFKKHVAENTKNCEGQTWHARSNYVKYEDENC